MFNNVFETLIPNGNEVHLNIPKEDFLFSYNHLNYENAKDFVANYFQLRSRDGIPEVQNIELQEDTNTIRISLKVNYNVQSKLESYIVPDLISCENISTKP